MCVWVSMGVLCIYLCGDTHKDNQFKLKQINSSINNIIYSFILKDTYNFLHLFCIYG